MKRSAIIMTLVVVAACGAAAQAQTFPGPLPPDLVVDTYPIGEPLVTMDLVARMVDCSVLAPPDGVGCTYRTLHVEAVTNGVRLNWISEPPWYAVWPKPDAILLYRDDLGAYCRYEPQVLNWECVALRSNGILYQRFDYDGFIWGRRIWSFLIVEVP